tara:strand:+ start:75 stop:254 length:180 start_codon:yes stop_codon:yes gene_type:complete
MGHNASAVIDLWWKYCKESSEFGNGADWELLYLLEAEVVVRFPVVKTLNTLIEYSILCL